MRWHIFPPQFRSRLERLWWPVLLIAIAVATWFFLERLLYELSGALASDSLLFLTVGRGILNGLMPWRDLFETKPPGIFLLSAASFWLTGTQLLAKIAQVLALIGVAVFAALACIPAILQAPMPRRKWYFCVAVLFGLLLALYTGDQAGLMLPESYAACFAVAYVALLSGDPSMRSWKSIGIAALCILLAAGFKEPFFLTVLVCAFLLCRSRELPRSFLLPSAIAIAAGVIGLMILGYFSAFFTLYLRHMVGYHVDQNSTPVFLRALQGGSWLFGNVWGFSPFLALAFLVMWVEDLVARFGEPRGRERWAAVVIWGIAVYLTLFAIGVGGNFYGHHAMFAVPVTVVFLVLMLRRHLPSEDSEPSRTLLQSFTALLVATAIGLPFLSRVHLDRQAWKRQEQSLRSVASAIDTVMDRCGIDRYLSIIDKGGSPTAFTRHSPYGPLFAHYYRLHEAHPRYDEAFGRQLFTEAQVLFMRERENTKLTGFGWTVMDELYTDHPWDCAKPFVQPEDHTIFFRKAKGVVPHAKGSV